MTHKDKLLAFSALTILLTAGFPALAQEDVARPDHPPMGDERPERPDGPKRDHKIMEKRGAEMFSKADSDKDGFLSKSEMLKAHEMRIDEMFSKTDSNHDGKLSPEEMKKGREAMHQKFKEKMQEKRENWKEKKDDIREKHGKSSDRPASQE